MVRRGDISSTSQRYFFPAATTLCLKTKLPNFPSTLANGLIIAFVHTSNTSPKNALIASSVCGLVALFGILVLPLPLLVDRPPLDAAIKEGFEVYGTKGGKALEEEAFAVGDVLGGWGRWRSMKRVLVGVRKVEMWEEANWSVRLRYLIDLDMYISF